MFRDNGDGRFPTIKFPGFRNATRAIDSGETFPQHQTPEPPPVVIIDGHQAADPRKSKGVLIMYGTRGATHDFEKDIVPADITDDHLGVLVDLVTSAVKTPQKPIDQQTIADQTVVAIPTDDFAHYTDSSLEEVRKLGDYPLIDIETIPLPDDVKKEDETEVVVFKAPQAAATAMADAKKKLYPTPSKPTAIAAD